MFGAARCSVRRWANAVLQLVTEVLADCAPRNSSAVLTPPFGSLDCSAAAWNRSLFLTSAVVKPTRFSFACVLVQQGGGYHAADTTLVGSIGSVSVWPQAPDIYAPPLSRELEALHNKFLGQAREKMKARGDSQVSKTPGCQCIRRSPPAPVHSCTFQVSRRGAFFC